MKITKEMKGKIYTIVANWVDENTKLEKLIFDYRKVHAFNDPMIDAVRELQRANTTNTSTILGDKFDWLMWHLDENALGKNKLTARASYDVRAHEILTPKQLADLIIDTIKNP